MEMELITTSQGKTTLSDNQIREAVMIAAENLVQVINQSKWSVTSLNKESSYDVVEADQVHAYDLYCKCKGWQFKKGQKDCKHCEAVRIFIKAHTGTNTWHNISPKRRKTSRTSRSRTRKTSRTSRTRKTSRTSRTSRTRSKPKVFSERYKEVKQIKVECWHCGDKDQTLDLDNDQAFECSVCKELLWRGDGGYKIINGKVCESIWN